MEEQTNKYFLVSIHDVAAPFLEEVLTILDNIGEHVGSEISLAVTPTWHGESHLNSTHISRILERANGDILVHGKNHYRSHGYGIVSHLTKRSDEFNGLSLDAALQIANQARTQLKDKFEQPVLGFVPPAWQFGRLTIQKLIESEFQFVFSYFGIHFRKKSFSLANYSWDNGEPRMLGHVGHFLGTIASRLPNRLPCITFHPRDVVTGFDKAGYRLISRLQKEGFSPIKPSKLVGRYEAG